MTRSPPPRRSHPAGIGTELGVLPGKEQLAATGAGVDVGREFHSCRKVFDLHRISATWHGSRLGRNRIARHDLAGEKVIVAQTDREAIGPVGFPFGDKIGADSEGDAVHQAIVVCGIDRGHRHSPLLYDIHIGHDSALVKTVVRQNAVA